jgi:hypothetical protein
MGIPTLPNEVNSAIQHLMRRDVKLTRNSRLKRLIKTQKKQQAMLNLVLPTSRKKSYEI